MELGLGFGGTDSGHVRHCFTTTVLCSSVAWQRPYDMSRAMIGPCPIGWPFEISETRPRQMRRAILPLRCGRHTPYTRRPQALV